MNYEIITGYTLWKMQVRSLTNTLECDEKICHVCQRKREKDTDRYFPRMNYQLGVNDF